MFCNVIINLGVIVGVWGGVRNDYATVALSSNVGVLAYSFPLSSGIGCYRKY
jgi:hypothetical protein